MKPLTDLQRRSLERRVALSAGWEMLSWSDRDVATRYAKTVVYDLEMTAVHGASEKRAAEMVCEEVPDVAVLLTPHR